MNFIDKLSEKLSTKKSMTILSFIGLYLLSTGVSLAIFSYLKTGSPILTGGIEDIRSRIANVPKTEECPINGGMFTNIEKDIWEKRRPIAAMIENHADSRPASGLSKADIVYEAVAEGGITRFLAIFYCGTSAQDTKIAPVRSARVHFIDWASEYGDFPIFMHVGGANNFSGTGETVKEAQALELLERIGWRTPRGNDFDTTYDSGFPVFWRNYERLEKEVATEHTMMASLDAAYKQAEKRGFGAKNEGVSWDKNFTSWLFKDDKPASSAAATNISFKFWDGKEDYDVSWQYDQGMNSYLRSNGGKKFIDLDTKEQIAAKNVVVMFVKERGPVDRNLHMLYTTTGGGKAIVFQNGEAIEATWEKDAREDRTIFLDKKGKEISFVRGITWIEAVPSGNSIDY